MTNKRIGRYQDPHNPEDYHWIETQTIPSIILDVSVMKAMYQPDESQAMINEFETGAKIDNPVVEYYLKYEDAEEAVSLVGKVNVGGNKFIESSPIYVNPEEFGEAVFNAAFKTEKNRNGKLESSPLMHEAIKAVNSDLSEKFFTGSGVIIHYFGSKARGFLMLKDGGVKIATLENVRFSEDDFRTRHYTIIVDEVISTLDFSEIEDLKITLEFPQGLRVSANVEGISVLDGTNQFKDTTFEVSDISVSRIKGDEEVAEFEEIEDESDRIQKRIALLDNTKKERVNTYNRFFDLL